MAFPELGLEALGNLLLSFSFPVTDRLLRLPPL